MPEKIVQLNEEVIKEELKGISFHCQQIEKVV